MKIIAFSAKPVYFVLILFVISHTGLSQDILWERSYGGRQADYLLDLQPTADYGFIMGGSSLSGKSGNKTTLSFGDLDYYIWKMDENGEPEWQKSFGGPGLDLLNCIRNTPDGGFLLAGTSDSDMGGDKKDPKVGDKDFWIIKLDAGGNEQWQKTIGGTGTDELSSVVLIPDGGYLLGGTSASSPVYDDYSNLIGHKTQRSRGNSDFWIIRLDKDGNVKWQQTYGGQYSDILRSISPATDGGFIVGGYSNSSESGEKTTKSHGMGDFWILKLSTDGSVQWQQTYGGADDDQLYTVSQTRDGNYLAAGSSRSAQGHNKQVSARKGSDFWIIKMDETGNTIWQESYDFGKLDLLSSVIENPDGTYLIGGSTKSEVFEGKDPEGVGDYVVLKLANDGKEIWRKTVGSFGEDVLRKAIETRDGGYILAGTSNPYHRPVNSKRKTKSGLNGQLAGLETLENKVQEDKKQALKKVNHAFSGSVQELKEDLNNTVAANKAISSAIKISAPPEIVQGSSHAGSQANSLQMPSQRKNRGSGDKKQNYGSTDFWVVKLKDNQRETKARPSIEAIPNPAIGFTNVIVSYEFEGGTATVFDLSGRQVIQFAVDAGRTIPVDMRSIPEGIYLIEIKTNKRSDVVKVVNTQY